MARYASLVAVFAALVVPVSAAHGSAQQISGTFGPTTVVVTNLCSFPITVTLSGDFHDVATPSGTYVSVTFRTVEMSANGLTVSGSSPYLLLATESGTAVAGLVFRFLVPGVGLLALDAGRVVFDQRGIAFEAGLHPLLRNDAPQLCAYLAGE